eukprot:TRINITY_DN81_c0_g1_i1.p1 TRINITY_DN81_c0_g1~~TRINITY_DN81_c0_g1_i1.p1  ORF type:complete len:566 (+),score=131.33 TRINITY_DN81_c0_g1_i1:57-1754(+)
MSFMLRLAAVAAAAHSALASASAPWPSSDDAPQARKLQMAGVKQGSYSLLLDDDPTAGPGSGSLTVRAAKIASTIDALGAMAGVQVEKTLPEVGVLVVTAAPNSASRIKQAAGAHVKAVVPTLVFYTPAVQSGKVHRMTTDVAASDSAHGDELSNGNSISTAADPELKSANSLRDVWGGESRRLLQEPDFTPLQWSRKAMKIDRAFKAGLKGGGKRPARVAVIDTGFWLDHPSIAHYNKELSFNFVPGEKLMFNTKLTWDGSDLSHGTHTSSIIGGADLGGKGTIGVAPKADLVLLKVLGEGGSGEDHAILSAITYAASDSVLADVINLSLGSTINKRGKPGSYTAADAQFIIEMWTRTMQYAYQQGTTVIGATGEDIDGGISLDQKANLALVDIPTSLPHVIGVSATGPVFWGRDQTTNLDAFAPYSWYGSKIIDFAAPGGNTKVGSNHPGAQCTYKLGSKTTLSFACSDFDYVLSACCSKDTLFPLSEFNFATRYGWIAGTSMAAPHVAGVAALIVGKAGKRVSPDALLRHLKACTNDLGAAGKDAKYGNGRINAGKVVDLVL